MSVYYGMECEGPSPDGEPGYHSRVGNSCRGPSPEWEAWIYSLNWDSDWADTDEYIKFNRKYHKTSYISCLGPTMASSCEITGTPPYNCNQVYPFNSCPSCTDDFPCASVGLVYNSYNFHLDEKSSHELSKVLNDGLVEDKTDFLVPYIRAYRYGLFMAGAIVGAVQGYANAKRQALNEVANFRAISPRSIQKIPTLGGTGTGLT